MERIIVFLMLLILTTPVLAINLGQGVIIKSNETSGGYYKINQSFDANSLVINDSSVIFTFSNNSVLYDVTNSVTLTPLCINCILNSIDSIIDIMLFALPASISNAIYKFGIANTTYLVLGMIIGTMIALSIAAIYIFNKKKEETEQE